MIEMNILSILICVCILIRMVAIISLIGMLLYYIFQNAQRVLLGRNVMASVIVGL